MATETRRRKTRRTIEGTAGTACLSSDGRAIAKAHENKEDVARSCLAFDEAEYGVFVRKAEKVLDKCSTRKSELEGGKVKGRTRR